MSNKSNHDIEEGNAPTPVQARDLPIATSFGARCLSVVAGVKPASFTRLTRQEQRRYSLRPPLGQIRLSVLRSLEPINPIFGSGRGLASSRFSIQHYLSAHVLDIRDYALDLGDDSYPRQCGGGCIIKSDVLHALRGNLRGTVLADRTCADHIPANIFELFPRKPFKIPMMREKGFGRYAEFPSLEARC